MRFLNSSLATIGQKIHCGRRAEGVAVETESKSSTAALVFGVFRWQQRQAFAHLSLCLVLPPSSFSPRSSLFDPISFPSSPSLHFHRFRVASFSLGRWSPKVTNTPFEPGRDRTHKSWFPLSTQV